MNHHFLLNAVGGALELSSSGFLVAVAVLACLLGAEVAGIVVLTNKILRGQREKQEMDQRERESSDYYHYGFPVMLLGAIPQATYTALSVVAALAAVAAVVLAVLLIVAFKKGYLFISVKDFAALAEAEKSPKQETVALPEDTEEQRQDAFTEQADAEPAFTVFEEAPEETFEDAAEEDLQAVAMEQLAEEEAPQAPAPVADPLFADGTQPYKIVEKIVTETQKEVIREVPVSSPAQTDAAEQLMEKLTDFLDYELQKRKEADLADAAESTDTVATFSQKEFLPEDEEDDGDDEDELDENDGAVSDEEDDIDFEEPDSEDRFTGNERIVGFDENTGCYLVAHYRKSFEAKLIQARPRIKEYYSELKNALLSYKGTKSRISWTADSFHNGRTQIAKINVKTNILELYLALEPESLDGTVYRGRNVGGKKKYAETPFQYKLRTPRKFKWAMELVQRTCEEQGLSPIDIEKIDYVAQYPFESTESLVERKLIKEYIREEKPATTFELAPDHVPEVPEEDGSVIPANANFFWELDNDALPQEEETVEEIVEEVEEEILQEPAPVEEVPAATEAADAEPAVVKETVKITEMRYTERYYANAEPSFEQTITTHEAVLPANEDTLVEDEPFEEETVEEETVEEEPVEEFEIAEEQSEAVDEEFGVYASPYTEPVEEIYEEQPVEEIAEEEEFFFDEQPTEEIIYEEVYEEEPTEEEFYEEVYEEEPAEEEFYEEVYEEEPTEEEFYEEVYEEEPAEEEFYEEVYEEEPAEEEFYEEVYEEEPAEEEFYEEVYEEEPAEEVIYEEPVRATKVTRDAVPTNRVPMDPSVALIDICTVSVVFRDGDTVNLETLKAKGLVVPTARTLKIYAGGSLDKRLTVEAHHFSLEAIFAIGTAGGETSMLY